MVSPLSGVQAGIILRPGGLSVNSAFGTSRDEIRLHHPAYMVLLMGFEMTAAMVAWMRFRGHGWRGCAEMAVAMVVPAIPLIACLQTHVLAVGATNGLYMASMPVAMLALMFDRRSEYSMQMQPRSDGGW